MSKGDGTHGILQKLCFDHGFHQPEDMLRKWREEGLGAEAMANRLRYAVSTTSIYTLLKRYGIPTKDRKAGTGAWKRDMRKHFIKE